MWVRWAGPTLQARGKPGNAAVWTEEQRLIEGNQLACDSRIRRTPQKKRCFFCPPPTEGYPDLELTPKLVIAGYLGCSSPSTQQAAEPLTIKENQSEPLQKLLRRCSPALGPHLWWSLQTQQPVECELKSQTSSTWPSNWCWFKFSASDTWQVF